jgi:hypothetical protein
MPLPLLAAISLGQAALGAAQAIGSGAKARERELDAYAKQSPLYKRSKSVDDYYQEAMNRYRENPYQSQQYQMGAMEARRSTAQALGAMQGRRVLGDISTLAERERSNLQRLGAQAESQRNARFGQLGGATQMKTGEEYKEFDINKMTPYNRMLQLKQLKAQAANDRYNAGMQMIGGAASNAALGAMYGGFDKTPKVSAEASNINLNPYSQMAVSPSEFGTNYINYSTSQSANPSAFGTNFMEFSKNNKFKAPKGYKSF